MSKTLKKSLSLILALILTLSSASFAFAATPTDESEPLDKEDAEALAVEFFTYKSCSHITTDDIYDDGLYYRNMDVYKIISTAVLEDDSLITYTAYVDKYSGKVYYRNANFWLPIASIFNPLTQDEAFEYALKALCADKEKVVVLESEEVVGDNGKTAYRFLFCENFYERHECTIEADSGFIDDVVVMRPTGIVDRIVLLLRVLIAKLMSFSIF